MMITTSFFPILSINEDVPTSYKPFCTDHSHSPHSRCTVYLLLLPLSFSSLTFKILHRIVVLWMAVLSAAPKVGDTISNIKTSVYAGCVGVVCTCGVYMWCGVGACDGWEWAWVWVCVHVYSVCVLKGMLDPVSMCFVYK